MDFIIQFFKNYLLCLLFHFLPDKLVVQEVIVRLRMSFFLCAPPTALHRRTCTICIHNLEFHNIFDIHEKCTNSVRAASLTPAHGTRSATTTQFKVKINWGESKKLPRLADYPLGVS